MMTGFRACFPVLIAIATAAIPVAFADDKPVATIAMHSVSPVLGPDAAACAPDSGQTAALVTVSGFKDHTGNIRVQLYPDNDKDFLRSGKKLTAEGKVFRRVEAPTPANGDALVCVQLPSKGRFTMAVMHDRNGDGKLNVFSDGYGFPNNPKVKFGAPDADKVAFDASDGITELAIRLRYF